jgi:hypothetical protein
MKNKSLLNAIMVRVTYDIVAHVYPDGRVTYGPNSDPDPHDTMRIGLACYNNRQQLADHLAWFLRRGNPHLYVNSDRLGPPRRATVIEHIDAATRKGLALGPSDLAPWDGDLEVVPL